MLGEAIETSGEGSQTHASETVGLIGHPVDHSLSPAIHSAAFAAAGLDWRYLLRDVPTDRIETAIKEIQDEHWRGFNVTLPHKQTVAPFLDELTDTARRAGAVNTVVSVGGRLIGDNTDVRGFGRALQVSGWRPQDHPDGSALVLGTGGAARAAITWLTDNRVPVIVVGRTPSRAADLVDTISGAATGLVTALTEATVPDVIATRCELVVQATSSGRSTPQWLPFRFEALPRQALCFDLNYDRLGLTPFCAAATANGLVARDGLRMLVEQAAVAFSRWTGLPAPLAAMLAAVQRPGEEQ